MEKEKMDSLYWEDLSRGRCPIVRDARKPSLLSVGAQVMLAAVPHRPKLYNGSIIKELFLLM